MALVSKAVHVEWTREQNNKKERKDKIWSHLSTCVYLSVCLCFPIVYFCNYVLVGREAEKKKQLKSSESVQVIQIERQTQRELLNEIMYVPLLLMLLKRKKMDRLDNIFSASLDQSMLEYMAAAVFFLSLILFVWHAMLVTWWQDMNSIKDGKHNY